MYALRVDNAVSKVYRDEACGMPGVVWYQQSRCCEEKAKIFILLLVCIVLCQTVSAQETGIRFMSGTYTEALQRAKAEGRPVFLYFHFDGCGGCEKMENTAFIDAEVSEYYNDTFVCFEVNTQNGEGLETNKIHNVRMHLSFVYLDSDGGELHTAVGVFTPADFLGQGRIALDPERRLRALDKRYAAGDRDTNILLGYCYALRDAYQLTSKHIREYLATLRKEDLLRESTMRFIYEFALHQYDICVPFGSPAYQSMYENRARYAELFDSAQVTTRLVWIAHSTAQMAIELRSEKLLEKIVAVIDSLDSGSGHEYRELDGRLTGAMAPRPLALSLWLWYYEETGDSLRYAVVLPVYLEKIWSNSAALNDLAWSYYENVSDTSRLEQAIRWIERSLEVRRHYNNLDTYATLLYKLGRLSEALTQAEQAIEQARKEDEDSTATRAFLEKIRASMNEESR
jgi:thioredoxin-related protein/tetratricopeptide (TPR) repeat protein